MESGIFGPEGLVGRDFAGYHLERLIGTGATGAVFLAHLLDGTADVIERTGKGPIELPEQAAIKVLFFPWGTTADEKKSLQARFVREAAVLQRLRHPHILSVLLSGEDAATGLLYMVLPYMSGGTLAAKLSGGAQLPLATAQSYLTQLAAALDYAHSQDIVHRDVKPANMLLDDAGQLYLADFSIVHVLSETQTKLTTTGRLLGTPAYMAPEQLVGEGDVGLSVDVYAAGMVVYEMVTGRVAFEATSKPLEVIRQHAHDDPPPPCSLRPDLPEPAEAAILRALEKDPAQRYGAMQEFAVAFAEGLQGRWVAGLTASIRGRDTVGAGTALHDAVTEPAAGGPPLPQKHARPRVGVLMTAALMLLALAVVGVGLAAPGGGVVGDALAFLGMAGVRMTPTATTALVKATATAGKAVLPRTHPPTNQPSSGTSYPTQPSGQQPTAAASTDPTAAIPTDTPMPKATDTPVPYATPTQSPQQVVTQTVNSHYDTTTYGGNTASSSQHFVVVNVTMYNPYSGTESFTLGNAALLFVYNLPQAGTVLLYPASFQTNVPVTLAPGASTTVDMVFLVDNYNGWNYAVEYIEFHGNWIKGWQDNY